jgi:hypothetical protein
MGNNDRNIHTSTAQQNQQNQPLPFIQFVVGLLLGSGGAGATVAWIGKEGFQIYGLVASLIFITFAVGFAIWGLKLNRRRERDNQEFEERMRRENLNLLNNYYIDGFKTIGDLLARSLQDGEKKLNASDVFKILVTDLRTMGQERKGENKRLIDLFRDGTKEIADKWEELAKKGVPEEVSPKQEE